ncbi:hypothetical protein NW759_002941 [Fusarium solani]|nr:hypothetical protein NW759_002941 [Fusarium solani]
MSQQRDSTLEQAQASEEVVQSTGEQEKQPQTTGAPDSGADNTDTKSSNNDGDDGNDTNDHKDDSGSNPLYELLLNAEHDDDAMDKLKSNWDQLRKMVNTPCPSAENKTALHLAAENGFGKVVEKLLGAGAGISVSDDDGWKPLHFACFKGRKEVVEALLRSGADPKATSKDGRSPLDMASMYGKVEVAGTLLEKDPSLLNQRSTALGWPPLHWATWQDSRKMVAFLLGKGADIDAKDDDGWTPLMVAVKSRNEKMMDTLIKHIQGLKEPNTSHHLDVCDEEQKTPLMAACEDCFEKGVKALCKANASCDAQDYAGRTALHYAVKSGQLVIAETLTNYTDPKVLLTADHNGASAFDDLELDLRAGEQGPLGAFASLLLDCLIKEKMQREALGWAAQNTKRHKIFQMLVTSLVPENVFDQASAERPTAFEWAVRSRLPWALGLLVDNFPATEDLGLITKAERLAKELRETKPKKTEGKKSTPKNRGVESHKSKPDHDNPILHDMQNYLNDFTLAETHRRSLFKPPKPRDGVVDILPKFQATITQFFTRRTGGQQGRIRWIKHSRSVQEVIYGQGPTRIARDTMNRWFSHPWAESKDSSAQQDDETRLKWVHLPVTNIVWMEDLVKKILKGAKCSPEETQSLASFFRSSWVQVPDGTSASRFMRPLYVAKRGDEHDTATKESHGPRPLRVSAAYFPYLSFSKNVVVKDSYESRQREASYKELLEVYKEDALHQSATLDEAYYHFALDPASKEEQDVRNKTQVVTEYLRGGEGESLNAWTLIRVKQLWIWTILDEWIITATPHPVDGTQEDDLPKDFLNHPSTQERVGEASPQSTFAAHIATLIANYCVDAYERKRVSPEGGIAQHNDSSSSRSQDVRKERSTRSIRQIFSDSVNLIARKEKKLFENFHKLCGRGKPETTPSNNDRTRYVITGKVHQPMKDAPDEATDEAKSLTTDDADDLETVLTNASELACSVKDIRDELNILRSIVNFQLTVQKDMAGNPESSTGITAHYFWKDIEELENVARRVQESVNTTLNLVETETANEQSRQAARQGRTMLVFTVVTILFLPLSFLSSLFALDVTSFQQAPNWALIVIFLASFTFFIPVASIALFSESVARRWHKCWDYWNEHVKPRKIKTNECSV